MMILHGGAGRASIDGLVAHFAGGQRVLAPTHPGFGDTERPSDLGSVADLARYYLGQLEEENITGATVIGTSFGGWVAAEMAATDHGGRLKQLVLIDAIGPRIPGHTIEVPSAPPGRGPSPEALAALRAYTGAEMQDPSLLERVSRVTIPVLLVWGENDPVVRPEFGRAYAEAFPRGRFELIAGGGHLPMREAPDQTYAAIDNFLSSSTPGIR